MADNVAVHDYVSLNIDVIRNILEKHLDDFTEYTSTLLGLESAGD